jgi:hypothetical protein
VDHSSGGGSLRLDGQFDGGPYRIEKISFADGSSIDLTAPLTFTGDVEGNSIYATSGNDTLIGKGGNDNLYVAPAGTRTYSAPTMAGITLTIAAARTGFASRRVSDLQSCRSSMMDSTIC